MTNNEEYFEKNVFVHERNDKEELLPVDIEIKIKKVTAKVSIIPMTKGEIDEMRNKALVNKKLTKTNKEESEKNQIQQDKDLILNHIINPKFDEKDIKFLKPKETVELTKAIMIASGFEREEVETMFKRLVTETLKEMNVNPQL